MQPLAAGTPAAQAPLDSNIRHLVKQKQIDNHRIDVFFYGLFMDAGTLGKGGAAPTSPRRAYVDNFALRIGQRATLVPSVGARVYGMLFALTHAELARLYSAPSLEHYCPEAVIARTLDGATVPALCYNLIKAPRPEERNPEYAARLQVVLSKLEFPADYVASISRGI